MRALARADPELRRASFAEYRGRVSKTKPIEKIKHRRACVALRCCNCLPGLFRYFWLACRRPPELRMLRAKSRRRKQIRRIQPAHRASRQGPRQVPPLLRGEI